MKKQYFIIVNPDSEFVSFSETNHDICFGDQVPEIIPNYTNKQYADAYGDRVITYPCMTDISREPEFERIRINAETKTISKTIREYMRENCRMHV